MKIARREGPVAERMGERDLDGNVETEVHAAETTMVGTRRHEDATIGTIFQSAQFALVDTNVRKKSRVR